MINPKEYKRNNLKVSLTFNEGYAEIPIYSIKANTSEKKKGIDMFLLIRNNFGITQKDIDYHEEDIKREMTLEFRDIKKKIDLSPPMNLHRDEDGNLSSPFSIKKKAKD